MVGGTMHSPGHGPRFDFETSHSGTKGWGKGGGGVYSTKPNGGTFNLLLIVLQ